MSEPSPPRPTLDEAARVWTQVALLSFGGPAGQIAVMHRILVEERRWLGDGRFLHALNFCMILPGPEAQQLATYIGWLMHGVRGALIAGGLFILPGVVSIMALSWIHALWGEAALVGGLFFGLKAAVLAIVVQALLRVGGRALTTPAKRAIAAASFIAIFVFAVPFPAIVLGAAALGWAGSGTEPQGAAGGGHGRGDAARGADAGTVLGEKRASGAEVAGAIRAGILAALLWLGPVAALLWLAPGSVFADIAWFFSRLAVLTFGGAYAVLAWVAQEAVGTYGWLAPGEMLDGLGMAETTPGPLIMVLQFVGFTGALREAGWAYPLLAGTLGGLLATWVTFAPCFAWIFLGAPFMERLRAHRGLAAALGAVTAAVVGVIANLALWFAFHALFAEVRPRGAWPLQLDLPVLSSLDPVAAVLTVAALVAVFVLHLRMAAVLGLAAGAGAALGLAGLA